MPHRMAASESTTSLTGSLRRLTGELSLAPAAETTAIRRA